MHIFVTIFIFVFRPFRFHHLVKTNFYSFKTRNDILQLLIFSHLFFVFFPLFLFSYNYSCSLHDSVDISDSFLLFFLSIGDECNRKKRRGDSCFFFPLSEFRHANCRRNDRLLGRRTSSFIAWWLGIRPTRVRRTHRTRPVTDPLLRAHESCRIRTSSSAHSRDTVFLFLLFPP